MNNFSEQILVDQLMENLEDSGYSTWVEVPTLGQYADIVATKNRWLTMIEAKLNNWSRAIEQCKAHEMVADHIWIAIATDGISDNFHSVAKEKGYGILHYNREHSTFVIVLKPQLNKKVWKPQRKLLKNTLKELDNVC